MKALVTKYPEVRDAFAAVVARAVDPSGQGLRDVAGDEGYQVRVLSTRYSVLSMLRTETCRTENSVRSWLGLSHQTFFRILVIAQPEEHRGAQFRTAALVGAARPLRVFNFGHEFRLYPTHFAQGLDFSEEWILLGLQLLQTSSISPSDF